MREMPQSAVHVCLFVLGKFEYLSGQFGIQVAGLAVALMQLRQCTALGFNDELIGVCQDMANNNCIAGRVTVAAGVDPLLVLALSTQLL